MPSNGHTEPPDEHRPCDCGGCAEFRAIHDGHCPELPAADRAAQRAADQLARVRYDLAVAADLPFIHARAV